MPIRFFIAEEVTLKEGLLRLCHNGPGYSANVTVKPYRFMFSNQTVNLFSGFLLPLGIFFLKKKKNPVPSSLQCWSVEKEKDGKATLGSFILIKEVKMAA